MQSRITLQGYEAARTFCAGTARRPRVADLGRIGHHREDHARLVRARPAVARGTGGERRAQVLTGNWRAARSAELRKILIDFTHDERILSAAACNADFGTLTSTPISPPSFPAARSAHTSVPPTRAQAGRCGTRSRHCQRAACW